jgi:hypothetical protein
MASLLEFGPSMYGFFHESRCELKWGRVEVTLCECTTVYSSEFTDTNHPLKIGVKKRRVLYLPLILFALNHGPFFTHCSSYRVHSSTPIKKKIKNIIAWRTIFSIWIGIQTPVFIIKLVHLFET